MSDQSDVILIGAGHNALVAAAYLGRAGLSVTVLEGHATPGGGTATEELTLPGFLHDPCASGHHIFQLTPLVAQDELGLLSERGLRYVLPDPAVVFNCADGETLVISRDLDATANEIARFSGHDAEAYRQLVDDWDTIAETVVSQMAGAPGTVPMDRTSSAAAKLGELAGNTATELIDGRFEDEHVRAYLYWLHTGAGAPPDRPGSGVGVVVGAGLFARVSWPQAVGGSRALIDALIAIVEANGGRVLCGRSVERILVEHDRAAGVLTTDGERFDAAQAVISSASATVLPKLLGSHRLPAEFEALSRWQAGSSMLAVHLALPRPPEYQTSAGAQRCVIGAFGTREGMTTQASDVIAGRLSGDDRYMMAACSSVPDPSRAPRGAATLKVMTVVPYRLNGDAANWDGEKERYADRLLSVFAARAEGYELGDELGRFVESPLDIERRNPQMVGGSPTGGDSIPEQSGANRPVPGWAGYRMPVTGLYQTGSSTHPGGAVTGLAGRSTARALLEDLEIDTASVMASAAGLPA